MKQLFSLLICLYTFNCNAQELASVTLPANENTLHYAFANPAPGKTHSQSVMTSIGTWSMLGGAVIFLGGYIEYKSATKTDGPFTFVDESKQHLGTLLEVAGGTCFVVGLVMIITDAADRHPQHSHKVSIAAPAANKIGIAYNF